MVRSATLLTSIVHDENAEILHCHFRAYDIAAWAVQGRLRLGGHKLRLVWHAHSEIPVTAEFLQRFKNFVKYACLGSSTRMIAVSEHVRRQAVAAGYPAEQIAAILNGIDFDWATTAARSKSEVASELAIPSNHHLLLMIGWNPPRKGVDLALAAGSSLIAEGHSIVLGILGTEWLNRYLGEQKIEASCPWVRQISPTDDIASLYQAATVFLSPSRSEGFTYAACEALANGTPVVLADIPPVAWARGCPGAAFCRVGDADSLRDAIRGVRIGPTPSARQRAKESSRYVRENFDVNHWAEQVAAFYWGPPETTKTGAARVLGQVMNLTQPPIFRPGTECK